MVAVALAAFGVTASAASAEIRSGSASDPMDMPASIDGVSESSDLEAAWLEYDTAGSITAVYRFYRPLPDETSLGVGGQIRSGERCDLTFAPGSRAYINIALRQRVGGPSGPQVPMSGSVTLEGVDGEIAGAVTISADRRDVMIEASHPMLANRDYRCAYANSSSFVPRYWSLACGCFIYTELRDSVEERIVLAGSDRIPRVIPAAPAPVQPPSGPKVVPAPAPEGTTPRPRKIETLPQRVAVREVRSALTAKFGAAFRSGTRKSVRCARRSPLAFDCHVRWNRPGKRYTGTVKVTRYRKGTRTLHRRVVAVRTMRSA